MDSAQPHIAILHGFGFDDRIWNPVELAFEHFEVIHLSLPGFGNDTLSGAYSLEDLARHFWADLDVRGVNQLYLLGHSMGGYACMEMIAQQPHRVSGLGLIHSHVFADSEEKKAARTASLKEIKSSGHEAFVRRMIPGMVANTSQFQPIVDLLIHRGMQYREDAWYNGIQAIRDRRDHTHTLSRMEVPVLIVAGELDTAVPVKLAYQQAALVEKAHLLVYPGVGHLSMYENTSGLICDIASFLPGASQ